MKILLFHQTLEYMLKNTTILQIIFILYIKCSIIYVTILVSSKHGFIKLKIPIINRSPIIILISDVWTKFLKHLGDSITKSFEKF